MRRVRIIYLFSEGKLISIQKIKRELGTWWSLRHPNVLPCMGYVEAECLGEYGAIVSPVSAISFEYS
jgi:hypothetical protein